MAAPVISVVGVSKNFPGVRALSDVRFELMSGEVHALMGEKLPTAIDTGFYWYDKTKIDDPKIAAVLYD